MEFAEIGAHKQVRPGGFMRMAYIDDIDHAPQFCRCYLPLNYDPSKKWPMVVYLHGYYENIPEYYNLWDVNKRHESASDKQNVIFIEPHGRGNTQYLGIGDRDVMKCIEMAKQRFSVDDDKVYLMGSSMGGFGTWNVATRHPELFAAIAPIYGGGDYHVFISKENIERMSASEIFVNEKSSSTAQMESLLNMPILVSHGDQDQSVNVNLSRYIVRLLQRWNYDVRYIEVPEKGHADLGLWDQIISWLLQHRRNAAPKHVRVRSADLRTASAYWVKVGQRNTPSEFVDVDAEALEDNMIRVDSKNVCELSLTPDKTLVDYDKPIRVMWNGKITLVRDVQAEPIVLKDENYKPLPLHKTPLIAGPISDFQNTPFIIVVGTISKDTMMKRVIEQKVGPIVGDWKAVQKYEPRVKKDVDVTDAEMKEYSLFLLGGPEDNKISKQVFERTPFAVTSSEVVVDGKSFKAKDAVLNAIYPNPYNSERYVDVVVATSAAGFSFLDPRRTDLSQFDFYVTDGKIPVFSAGVKGEKIIIASGFFDRNWKIDSSFLNEGDENLRSKCAYYAVNSNLSMTVVSIAKPSVELLKSYVGTYHVEGGPEVRVFLENDILKAVQGEFSVKLHPTADNEFYVQEINLSVAFRKDGATNDYSMIVYQNGQEYTARRVK
jgi:pimeloyl-ACP methyl ester carboxylesterase